MTFEQVLLAIIYPLAVYSFVRTVVLDKETRQMALGQAELDAAVKAVEDDVANVVNAIHDARTQIDALTKEVADLVAAQDTTAIVNRLTAVDQALDAAAPGTAPPTP